MDGIEETFPKFAELIRKDLLWFYFGQNNSGGYFVRDSNVDEGVFVQALTAAEAINKAESFMDNSDSCPCCGDRWSFLVRDEDGTPEPTKYGKPLSEAGLFSRDSKFVLHFFDGRIEKVAPGKPGQL